MGVRVAERYTIEGRLTLDGEGRAPHARARARREPPGQTRSERLRCLELPRVGPLLARERRAPDCCPARGARAREHESVAGSLTRRAARRVSARLQPVVGEAGARRRGADGADARRRRLRLRRRAAGRLPPRGARGGVHVPAAARRGDAVLRGRRGAVGDGGHQGSRARPHTHTRDFITHTHTYAHTHTHTHVHTHMHTHTQTRAHAPGRLGPAQRGAARRPRPRRR